MSVTHNHYEKWRLETTVTLYEETDATDLAAESSSPLAAILSGSAFGNFIDHEAHFALEFFPVYRKNT
jgi:hypothetical protein